MDDPLKNPIPQSGSVTIGKEFEPATIKDVSGQEMELPKEVAAAGVKVQPTTVQLPQAVTQMGVTPVGAAAPPPTTVALPLTDDQIAQGLKLSIASSWRWLAEFCVRRLKQLHMAVKRIGGKTVRVKG